MRWRFENGVMVPNRDRVRRPEIARLRPRLFMPGIVMPRAQGGEPFSFASLQAIASLTNSAATHTFTGVSFGVASPSREIVACIVSYAGASLSSVTIGGVTATIDVGGGTNAAHIARAFVPSGTSGDIVVTHSASASGCAMMPYRLIRSSPGAAPFHSQFTSLTGTALNVALNLPAGGALVVSWKGNQTSINSPTPIGFTIDGNTTQHNSNHRAVAGSATGLAAATGATVGTSGSTGSSALYLAAASFAP